MGRLGLRKRLAAVRSVAGNLGKKKHQIHVGDGAFHWALQGGKWLNETQKCQKSNLRRLNSSAVHMFFKIEYQRVSKFQRRPIYKTSLLLPMSETLNHMRPNYI